MGCGVYMREFVKRILAKPILFFDKLVIGFYLYMVKKKTAGIKELIFSKKKVLILAPHQDDEVLGCGCFIQQGIEEGNKIKCVFMTDGSMSTDSINKETLAKIRKIEALEVAKKLKMELPEFLNKGDGVLDSNDIDASKKIAEIIDKFKPDIIMFPYFMDGHSDHSATSGILINAMELIKNNARLFAYEINSPISVYGITHYVDCTSYMSRKSDILKTYKSQTMSFGTVLLMNKLNGILAGTDGGVELFREIDFDSYKKTYEKYNKDNKVWMRFRQMYSIYFMVIAYFKGLGLKKEGAKYQDFGMKQ